MRALITGGAGFIGSHLAEALLEDGHDVVGVDDLSTGRRDNFPGGALLRKADISRPGVMDHVGRAAAPDVIYHCAGSYADPYAWERDVATNVRGTINVVRTAQSWETRIVYFQTSLCYGLNPGSQLLTTESPLAPVGSYAVSKTAGERYIADSGVDYVSLRLANVYGPRNLTGPVPAFYRRLSAGEPCTVADSRRDFLFVDDLIDVAVKAATRGSGVYHVSHGFDWPIENLYWSVADALGVDAPEPAIQPRNADDAPTILLDPAATERTFDWQAFTTLAEGIGRAVEWYAEHGVERTYTHLTIKG